MLQHRRHPHRRRLHRRSRRFRPARPIPAPFRPIPSNSTAISRQRPEMIVSMTGFGDASTERDGAHYAVEIRSLNNRYFKSTIKLPDNVSGLEPEIETTLREHLGRG